MLDRLLSSITGIGPKRASLLEKLGLFTLRDMLYFFPRDYKDFTILTPCAALDEGERCSLVRIAGEPRVAYPRHGLSIVTAQASDETGRVKLVWYNQPYMRSNIKSGDVYYIYGKVVTKPHGAIYENPVIEPAQADGEPRGIIPIYALTLGISQKLMRDTVKACLVQCEGYIEETLPEIIRLDMCLCELDFALENIHFPQSMDDLVKAKRRLSTEYILFFLVAVEYMAEKRKSENGIAFETAGLIAQFKSKIPFALTVAQDRVICEIERDMYICSSMNRLVQGDVGSGKTVLALFALFVAAKNGYQGVLMAPTELLARQHYQTACRVLGDFGVELLVGGLSGKQKSEVYARIEQGSSKIIIGTHAVIADKVKFDSLGVVIADEQQRFGVRQRAVLAKGNPDVLLMSATPIPRTLALILYGDLDVSLLDTMPPGRKTIKTSLVPAHKREDMYRYILEQAQKGRQTYVVCSLVEQSEDIDAISAEKLFEELSQGWLKQISVGLLHGRLSAQEKETTIGKFVRNEIAVLITTTVIEVGIDVPNATTMVIEDADRFGLSQLHQLRGRVGRGAQQSYCFLLSTSQTQKACARLSTLCTSSNGFEIAQKDLLLRGPGEFFGTKQSGAGNFVLKNFISDMNMITQIQNMAHRIIYEARYASCKADFIANVMRQYAVKMQDFAMN